MNERIKEKRICLGFAANKQLKQFNCVLWPSSICKQCFQSSPFKVGSIFVP